MIYTPMTKSALALCFEAHKDQVDKAGMPYVFHPFHVAEQFKTEEEVCVALLHDVLEDTDYTVDDIRAAGMSEEVIEALLLLTHDPATEYMDYIARIAPHRLARRVKMADLLHNSDRSRLDNATGADRERWRKYDIAYGALRECERMDCPDANSVACPSWPADRHVRDDSTSRMTFKG